MRAHPYIPNSVPEIRDAMLREIGASDINDLYREIPDELKLKRSLNIPPPLEAEHDLKKYILGLLAKNITCEEYANFLGAGCYHHFIPAVCDEINSRGEFLTAYAGAAYSDHGKHQAWFEFQSLLGELLEMDVVSFPTYDWSTAANSAVLMACRLTGRDEIVIPRNIAPDKLSHMLNYVKRAARVIQVDYQADTGLLDLVDLERKISPHTAAVYFENPTFFGVIEDQGQCISEIAHKAGAMSVVGVDPITLGVMAPPGAYGADLVVGDAQSLGVHMQAGGGLCGWIAGHDDQRVMAEYPTLFESIGATPYPGEWGFGWATLERTSYDLRDKAKDFTGTSTGLWAITAGVYLALMGPLGMREVGEAIFQKTVYAIRRLQTVKGLRVPLFSGSPFREFVVNFERTGKTVHEVNQALLEWKIFGGFDLSCHFPSIGQSALYCVTELTSKEEIDRLVTALGDVLV